NKLRAGVLVAWLSDGSWTDQVASASASSPAITMRARPPSSRRRRRNASRKESGRKFRPSKPRSIAAMVFSPQHRDETMKRLRGRLVVLPHGEADVAETGIRSVGLFARQIAARHHAKTRLAPEAQRHGLIAALRRNVEPEKESTRGTSIAVALADDLIGEIVFLRIEAAIFLHMPFIAIGGDRNALRRHRHLWRRNVAQLQKPGEECSIAGGKADAQPWQVGALRKRLELHHIRKVRSGGFEHAGGRTPGVALGSGFVPAQPEP